jgi:hypothetical protein
MLSCGVDLKTHKPRELLQHAGMDMANGFSADASIGGEATGAMSWAFISALRKNPNQSYVQLLNSIRTELEGKYDQKPQLSCSHPLSKFASTVRLNC